MLRELAERVRHNVRREDLFARYGGEEFALVLVETPHADAAAAAERIRGIVAGHAFRFYVLDVHGRTVVAFVGTEVMTADEFDAFLPSADALLQTLRFP